MTRLLASSSTLKGIERAIREFWASDSYSVDRETLRIVHPDRDMNARARVVLARGRYRFEALESKS